MPEPTLLQPDSLITIQRNLLAGLLAHALNTHALDDDGDHERCCATCCAPCGAVMQLAADGTLDAVLEEMGPGYDWWDDATATVSRSWLAEHIAPSCKLDAANDLALPI